MKRVVVTGVGVICSIGIGSAAFWENLIAGKSGIAKIRSFDASALDCQVAGEVPEYKISDFVPKSYRKATKVMARDIELAVVAADDAFKNAKLNSKAYSEKVDFDPKRFGCNIGAGLISAELNEITAAMHTARDDVKENVLDMAKWGSAGMGQLTPLWLLKYLPNMLACHVTIVHGLMGPSNTITCQEASSHLAIGEAFRTVQRGKAEFAICGGAESRVNPMGLMRQDLLNRLNKKSNDNPAGALRPFDTVATGTVYGEGGGLLILEEYEHAKARGATIYAELAGFAASQDTHNLTDPDPSGRSYAKAVENSLKDAGVSRDEIDLIVPNGIGMAGPDAAELIGLKKAFGERFSTIPFAPIKGQIGHLGAGSGADAVAAVLALHHGVIPPAVNTTNPRDGILLNCAQQARNQALKTSISTVYSLGGQNASIVFRKV